MFICYVKSSRSSSLLLPLKRYCTSISKDHIVTITNGNFLWHLASTLLHWTENHATLNRWRTHLRKSIDPLALCRRTKLKKETFFVRKLKVYNLKTENYTCKFTTTAQSDVIASVGCGWEMVPLVHWAMQTGTALSSCRHRPVRARNPTYACTTCADRTISK